MSDANLEEIRRARMQQLREGGGSGEGGEEDQKRQREADQRNSILGQILTPEAADRLGRIRLVKASRADDVENRLIMLARSGQLRQKITEDQLKEILGGMSEQVQQKEKMVVNRRTRAADSDDDDLEAMLERD